MTSPNDKKSDRQEPKSSDKWLVSISICLLVGGMAAINLFVVDDDLDVRTNFRSKDWQANLQSIERSTNDINKFAHQQFVPMGKVLQQQSIQLIARTNNTLAIHRNWCIPTELSTVLSQLEQFNPIESTNSTSSQSARPFDLQINQVNQTSAPDVKTQAVKDWCFSTGTKK
ncbi:MAG: hypothetical protein LH613_13005 [Chamaesiphon sp.]|nr:hypothetical protein [Chamaesiphon sp.]